MTTIPSFPTFRRLKRGDRSQIEEFCGRFSPFSDFGFVSLWAWDTDESCLISMLGNNLVFRLKDYTRDERFLTFLGQDAVAEAAEALLAMARRDDLIPELRLIPETVIEADPRLSTRFSVMADPDNFDYVFSVHDWAQFPTPRFRVHRKQVSKCRKHAHLDFRSFDPKGPPGEKAILDLFNRWVEQKEASVRGDTEQERTALHRIIELTGDNTLAASGFFDGERLVGFSFGRGCRAAILSPSTSKRRTGTTLGSLPGSRTRWAGSSWRAGIGSSTGNRTWESEGCACTNSCCGPASS